MPQAKNEGEPSGRLLTTRRAGVDRRRGLALLLGVVATSLGGFGCGLEPGSGQCLETRLEPQTTEIGSGDLPLTLAARLTADGKPVANALVGFNVHAEPPLGSEPNI